MGKSTVRLPLVVRITAKVSYEVLVVERIMEDKTWLGYCDWDRKQILILAGMSKRRTLQTFIHELLHAIQKEASIDLDHRTIHQLDGALEVLLRLNGWC